MILGLPLAEDTRAVADHPMVVNKEDIQEVETLMAAVALRMEEAAAVEIAILQVAADRHTVAVIATLVAEAIAIRQAAAAARMEEVVIPMAVEEIATLVAVETAIRQVAETLMGLVIAGAVAAAHTAVAADRMAVAAARTAVAVVHMAVIAGDMSLMANLSGSYLSFKVL